MADAERQSAEDPSTGDEPTSGVPDGDTAAGPEQPPAAGAQAEGEPESYVPEATEVGQAPRDVDTTAPLPAWSDADATAPLGGPPPQDADATAFWADADLTAPIPSDDDATAAVPSDADATQQIWAGQGPDGPPSGDQPTAVVPTDDIWSGRAGVPEPAMRDAVPPPEPQGPGRRTWWTPLLLALLALLLLGLVMLGVWLALRDNSPVVVPSPSVSPSTPTSPAAPSPEPSPAPVSEPPGSVLVPPVVGLTQQGAITALDTLGLTYRLSYQEDPAAPGTVVGTDPGPGTEVAPGTKITLIIAVPLPSSPEPPPSPEPSPEPDASATP